MEKTGRTVKNIACKVDGEQLEKVLAIFNGEVPIGRIVRALMNDLVDNYGSRDFDIIVKGKVYEEKLVSASWEHLVAKR